MNSSQKFSFKIRNEYYVYNIIVNIEAIKGNACTPHLIEWSFTRSCDLDKMATYEWYTLFLWNDYLCLLPY